MIRYIAPQVAEAFNCPHCGALAHQQWFSAYTVPYENEDLPWTVSPDEKVLNDHEIDLDQRKKNAEFLKKKALGIFFFHDSEEHFYITRVVNLDLSQCFSCKQLAVWMYNQLIHPIYDLHIAPNPDLSDDIKRDFIEAVQIARSSSRGSAALLRLCIQKICIELGEKGKNIDADIAALVKRGLDPKIQKALDIVSVIGNESVHPGSIDVRDDPDIVEQLLNLVNLIADVMISHPKAVENLYDRLPTAKRDAIAKRDS